MGSIAWPGDYLARMAVPSRPTRRGTTKTVGAASAPSPKRQRTAALQDAVALLHGAAYSARFWSAAVLCRFSFARSSLADTFNRTHRRTQLLFGVDRASFWRMFASREEAGRRLGDYLKEAGVQADL